MTINIADGPAIDFTVWTDWTLRITQWDPNSIPACRWPAEDFTTREILPARPAKKTVTRVEVHRNEVGELIGADIEIDGTVFQIRSFGGDPAAAKRV